MGVAIADGRAGCCGKLCMIGTVSVGTEAVQIFYLSYNFFALVQFFLSFKSKSVRFHIVILSPSYVSTNTVTVHGVCSACASEDFNEELLT